MTPALHPNLASLAGLVGSWRGEGRGVYPTITSFTYGEELRFWHNGKPFLMYTQRTWSLDDNRPLHGEMGYWRVPEGDRVELVLAHPTGIAEICDGTVSGGDISFRSTTVAGTPTAKGVSELVRTFRLDGDVLSYELGMAAVEQPLQGHLTATLRRVTASPQP